MVHLTALLTVLATSSLLVAATHQQVPRRSHHSRSARRLAQHNERSLIEPAALKRDSPPRVKKRAESKICRIRTSGSSSAYSTGAPTTTASHTSSTVASVSAEATQTATRSASSSIEAESDLVTATSSKASSTAVVTSTGKAASSAASTTTASTAASTGTASSSSLTPNGKKAGIAGGDSYEWVKDHIGWWYDWSASPSGKSGTPKAVNMLWGAGTVDSTDAERLAAFKALTTTPEWIIGFEEPDCSSGSGSAGFGYSTGVTLWDSVVAPWKDKGSVLLSPSMCHQAAESGWLAPFEAAIGTPWDVTNIHINKNSMDGVKADIDHYYNTYGKPIWVTEFACVDDSSSFIPCTDQSEINTFISEIVDLFEADSRVYAYAYSDGEGLGSVWPTVSNGALSESGQAYLSAISKY